MNFCQPNAAVSGARARWQRAQSLVFSTFIAGCLCTVLSCNTGSSETAPGSAASSVLTLPPSSRLADLAFPAVALSHDGAQIVSVILANGRQQLYLRSIHQEDLTPIPGTEGASNPLFSPDGQWIAFFADGKLKKISLADGTVLTLCDALRPRGASWNSDETIVFTPTLNSGLWQVPASGGAPQALTNRQEERSHRWPDLLPGGNVVLFAIPGGDTWDEAQIVAQQLDTGERQVLIEGGTSPRYMPTGHLLFARKGNLMAVPFDPEQLQVIGDPVPIVEGLMEYPASGSAQFSVSRNGTLVYVPGVAGEPERRLVWVDREGAAVPLPAPPRAYEHPRISPDGRQVAVAIAGPAANIFIYDIPSETLTQLTSEGSNTYPLWTPDGKRVTYRSTRTASRNVFWKPADGSSAAEPLTVSNHLNEPSSWSPDGQVLAFTEFYSQTSRDLWVFPLGGERKPQPFLQTPVSEGSPMFSPDGRWLVYYANDSGRFEVYVQPFPGPGSRRQISTDGGWEPVWSQSGSELFYRNGDQMMAVAVKTQPDFTAGTPRLLFEGQYERAFVFRPNYDVTPDGQRFLMVQESEQEREAVRQINVVQNWLEELERRVPTRN